MLRKCFILLLMVAISVVAGCVGKPVRDKIESSVEQSLPDIIGPAQSYSVEVYGPPLRAMKGKLDGVDITGREVKLPAGITVSRRSVQIRDLTVDPDTRQIQRVGSTRYEATLSEAEVNRNIKQRYPDIPGLNVGLNKGFLTVTAKPGISGIRATIEADSGVQVRDKRILELDLRDIRAVGISAPGFARNFINERIPSIFDVKDLGFDATVESVKIEPQGLTLSGDLDLMKMLEKQAKQPNKPTP